MFVFAHLGITLGTAVLVSGAVRGCAMLKQLPSASVSKNTIRNKKKNFSEIIGLKTLSEFLDIRLLMLGSLFPDIIDKPLEFLGFGDGRSITHTLIVSLIFLFAGLFITGYHKKTWLLAVAIGMVTHLVLDSMWSSPDTFFWPVYGWSFPSLPHSLGWLQISLWWSTLTTNMTVDITEGIGAFILIGLVMALAGPRKLKTFILEGKI